MKPAKDQEGAGTPENRPPVRKGREYVERLRMANAGGPKAVQEAFGEVIKDLLVEFVELRRSRNAQRLDAVWGCFREQVQKLHSILSKEKVPGMKPCGAEAYLITTVKEVSPESYDLLMKAKKVSGSQIKRLHEKDRHHNRKNRQKRKGKRR